MSEPYESFQVAFTEAKIKAQTATMQMLEKDFSSSPYQIFKGEQQCLVIVVGHQCPQTHFWEKHESSRSDEEYHNRIKIGVLFVGAFYLPW